MQEFCGFHAMAILSSAQYKSTINKISLNSATATVSPSSRLEIATQTGDVSSFLEYADQYPENTEGFFLAFQTGDCVNLPYGLPQLLEKGFDSICSNEVTRSQAVREFSFKLGTMYRDGGTLPVDARSACHYFKKAMELGCTRSGPAIKALHKNLTDGPERLDVFEACFEFFTGQAQQLLLDAVRGNAEAAREVCAKCHEKGYAYEAMQYIALAVNNGNKLGNLNLK